MKRLADQVFPSLNEKLMSVTAEMSHDPIGPCGPSEQSKSDRLRHCLMAAFSSALDFGVQAVVVVLAELVVVPVSRIDTPKLAVETHVFQRLQNPSAAKKIVMA